MPQSFLTAGAGYPIAHIPRPTRRGFLMKLIVLARESDQEGGNGHRMERLIQLILIEPTEPAGRET